MSVRIEYKGVRAVHINGSSSAQLSIFNHESGYGPRFTARITRGDSTLSCEFRADDLNELVTALANMADPATSLRLSAPEHEVVAQAAR